MANEENLANEYLDGTLSPDHELAFEKLIEKNERLASYVKTLEAIKKGLGSDKADLQKVAEDRKAAVLGRILDRLDSKPKKRSLGLFLPVPVLAAFVVAIVAVPVTTLALNRGTSSLGLAKESSTQIEPINVSSIANSIDVSANSNLPVLKNGTGIEVTIQVNTLDELLQLLEGSGGSREVKIQLPGTDVLTPIGDPAVIQAVNK